MCVCTNDAAYDRATPCVTSQSLVHYIVSRTADFIKLLSPRLDLRNTLLPIRGAYCCSLLDLKSAQCLVLIFQSNTLHFLNCLT